MQQKENQLNDLEEGYRKGIFTAEEYNELKQHILQDNNNCENLTNPYDNLTEETKKSNKKSKKNNFGLWFLICSLISITIVIVHVMCDSTPDNDKNKDYTDGVNKVPCENVHYKGSGDYPEDSCLTPDYTNLQAVDLDLPSGNLWAKNNLGEVNSHYPIFYAWGEISPKGNYALDTYEFYDGHVYTKYKNIQLPENLVGKIIDDNSTKWTIPSVKDFEELISVCQCIIKDSSLVFIHNNKALIFPIVGYKRYYDQYINHGSYIWTCECSKIVSQAIAFSWVAVDNRVYTGFEDFGKENGAVIRPIIKGKRHVW